tara:strand:+ start:2043 stop:2294 length:252 start_codon:yes stop_codon:yes gene_type:complete
MKFIELIIFLFLFFFTTHAFSKSNEYYQMVLANILTNCKTHECKQYIFEQEVNITFFNLMDVVITQFRSELSQKKKENLWLEN